MINTEFRMIIFFVVKETEALYSQQNKTRSWMWLRSCKIQTQIEESREKPLGHSGNT